jgi:hypothetical protein
MWVGPKAKEFADAIEDAAGPSVPPVGDDNELDDELDKAVLPVHLCGDEPDQEADVMDACGDMLDIAEKLDASVVDPGLFALDKARSAVQQRRAAQYKVRAEVALGKGPAPVAPVPVPSAPVDVPESESLLDSLGADLRKRPPIRKKHTNWLEDWHGFTMNGLYNRGTDELRGCSLVCGLHRSYIDVEKNILFDDNECATDITFGKGGLPLDICKVYCERWLVRGMAIHEKDKSGRDLHKSFGPARANTSPLTDSERSVAIASGYFMAENLEDL